MAELGGAKGDGYGYDIAINPAKNTMLTSSFTGWNNYMMDLGKLVKDGEAMKRFGGTMVAWDVKAMQPQKVFSVPGAPLEIRWSLNAGDNWAVTATALTSKIWLVKQDAQGQWQAKDVATSERIGIGQPGRGYGYQWWTYTNGSFTARGIFGQGIFIDPQRRLVIASSANWGGGATDPAAKEAREAFYRAVQQAVDAEAAPAGGQNRADEPPRSKP